MNRLILVIISFLTISSCNENSHPEQTKEIDNKSLSDMRNECIRLTELCKPKKGIPESELRSFWNIRVGHNLNLGRDMAEVEISPSGEGYGTKNIRLIYSHTLNERTVINSEISLLEIGPNNLRFKKNEISFPTKWTEEQYLTEAIKWLKLLRKKQEQHQKRDNKSQ